MEIKLNLNYKQLLKLVLQLPQKEKEKLAAEIQSDISAKKPSGKNKLQQLILEAPTWNDGQLNDYQEARKHIYS
jgi:hypothetical protein